MPFKVVGDTSGNVAEVDSVKNLLVTTPQSLNSTNSTKVGYTFIAAGPNNRALTSYGPMGRLATGVQTMEIFDPIDGTAVNSNIWNQPAPTTFTIAQSGTTGYMVLNSGSSVAVNAQCQINSIKRIQLINTFVPTVRILFKTPNVPQANATIELGYGTASGTTAATDGAFFTWNSSGEFRCVTIFNSVVQQSAVLTAPTVNVNHTAHITFRGTKVEFWIDEVLVAEVTNASGNPNPTSSSRVPLFARIYNGAISPVTAPELHIGAVSLWRNDLNTNKLWPTQMSAIGRGAYQSPVTTFIQTANHANSTSPTSATLSNTAAGYTTLGGRFQFAAPAGAATDFALFGFQVPADFQLIVTGLRIDAVNTGAAVATTATILDWGLGINSSAVSLATTDTATTWAPRRIPLGMQSWILGAAIGAPVETLYMQFDTPLVVDGGRFFHVILQVPVGTATASQVIRGDVVINGYFE
jgi:hypothetical protein